MELKPGYKMTEVGVIPEDWKDAPLGGLAEIRMCKRIFSEQTNSSGDIPFFKIGTFGRAPDAFISGDLYREYKRKYSFPKKGDVLLSAAGTLGRTVVYDGGDAYFQDSNIVWLDIDHGKITNEYLYQCYQTIRWASPEGSTISRLYNGIIRKTKIPLPPTETEQTAIATALSDVDELLATLDQVIAKKRDLKQAAMQQLLTGETRLPGFSGNWEVKQLGDIGQFLKGRGVKKDEAQSGTIPCIRYGEIYTHHNDYIKSFNSWISPKVAATATRLKQGDLLFAGSGETKEEIGKCVAFIDDCEAYAGGDTVILRAAGINPMFMGYYCNTAPIAAQKASKGQGDAVVHISAATLSSIVLALPSLPEQNAIATALSSMDSELSVLVSSRDKTRNIKQAMMQELLTGKTRLVEPRGANA